MLKVKNPLSKAQEIVNDEDHSSSTRLNVDLQFDYKKALINKMKDLLMEMVALRLNMPIWNQVQDTSDPASNGSQIVSMPPSFIFADEVADLSQTAIESLQHYDMVPLQEILSLASRCYDELSSEASTDAYKLLVMQYVVNNFPEPFYVHEDCAYEYMQMRDKTLQKLEFYCVMLLKFINILNAELLTDRLHQTSAQQKQADQAAVFSF